MKHIIDYMKEGHRIEIFSGGCPLCEHVINGVELGRCAGCKTTVYDVNKPELDKEKMKKYGIRAVPTIVIDGIIKVEGIPGFQWLCGDEFYDRLRKDYPLKG